MRRVCEEAEAGLNYSQLFISTSQATKKGLATGKVSADEAVAASAVKTAIDMKATLLVVLTSDGSAAQLVAKYRPEVPILALTDKQVTVRQLLCVRGVVPVFTESLANTDDAIKQALYWSKIHELAVIGNSAVAVHQVGDSYMLK